MRLVQSVQLFFLEPTLLLWLGQLKMATLVSKFTLDNTYNDDTANANHLLAAGTGNAFNIFNRKGSYSLDTNGSGFAQRTCVITGINTGNANRSFGGWINSSSIASVQSLI